MTTKLYQVHVKVTHPWKPEVNFVDFQNVEIQQAVQIAHQFQTSLNVINGIKITTQIVEVPAQEEIPSHEDTKPTPKGENTEEHKYFVKAIYTENGTKKSWIAPLVDTLPQAIQRAGRVAKSLRDKGRTYIKTQCIQFVPA